MHHAIASSINGATTVPGANKCAASPATLIGKTVKSVGKTSIKIGGDDVIGVTITFADGTQAMAVTAQAGMAKTIKGGQLLQIEPNGCQYSLT